LRNSVQNASYEQKDPLLIYKLESFNLFKRMVVDMNRKAVSILMRGQIPVETKAPEEAPEEEPQRQQPQQYKTGRGDDAAESRREPEQQAQEKKQPVRVENRIGRNDPCPCGSGKKYKQCHGKDA
jgi:preprotein translocase subunit SecA